MAQDEPETTEEAPDEPLFSAPRDTAIVFAVALAVRVLYFWTAHGPSFADPLIDADFNDAVAEQVARGGGFPPGPFWQPPLFPLLCAGLYRIFGHSLFVPRAANALFGSMTAALVFDVAQRLGLRRGFARAAGLAVALYGPLVFYDGELLPTSLGTFLGFLGLWIAITRRPTIERAAYAGGAIGVAALAIPPVGMLVPVVAWLVGRPERKHGFVALIAAIVALVPATAYNRARGGEWTFVATNGGLNFYLGNNPDADATQALRPGEQWEALLDAPLRAGARSPAQQDGYFVHQASSWCSSAPGACLGGLAHKARLLAMAREIPRNEDLYAVRDQSPVLAFLTLRLGSFALPWALVFPVAMAGLYAAFARRDAPERRTRIAIAIAALVLAAGPILFFVTGRYRAPLVPAAAVLAALGLEAIAAVDGRALALAAVSFVVGVFPVHLPVDDVSFAADMQFAIAGRRERLGDDAGAVRHFDQAIALRPDFLEARFNLGWLYLRHEDDADAAEQFRAILRDRPGHARTRVALGTALLTMHELEAAEGEFRTVLAADPENVDALVGLAEGAMFREDKRAATAYVDRAEAAGASPEQVQRLRQLVAAPAPGGDDEDEPEDVEDGPDDAAP